MNQPHYSMLGTEMQEEQSNSNNTDSSSTSDGQKKALLVVNCILQSIGNCGGPLIMRLYFLNGGKHFWFSSFLQTSGWPIILLPIAFSFHRSRRHDPAAKLFKIKPFLFLASAAVGLLTGLNDYIYAYGVVRLPVSTSSLIIASQLVFTAAFAYLLVKKKLTSHSVIAVILLTIGGAVLALHTSGDRSKGENSKEYLVGFLMLMELVYKKAKQETYSLVLEIQMVLCFFATTFCTVGMIVNTISRLFQKKKMELGETKYCVVLLWSAIIWRGFFLGAIGIIFCASSLLSGIGIAVLLPLTDILAVIFYKEKFQAEKDVSLVLSLCGFVSYFYGEFKQNKKN